MTITVDGTGKAGGRVFAVEDGQANRLCITAFENGSVMLHTETDAKDNKKFLDSATLIDSEDLEQLVAFLSQVIEEGQSDAD